jgi:hypothetical protein
MTGSANGYTFIVKALLSTNLDLSKNNQGANTLLELHGSTLSPRAADVCFISWNVHVRAIWSLG